MYYNYINTKEKHMMFAAAMLYPVKKKKKKAEVDLKVDLNDRRPCFCSLHCTRQHRTYTLYSPAFIYIRAQYSVLRTFST